MSKFLIEHIDPLAQGVFKSDEEIYFIPKTLPGESGEFQVLKKSKGVNFAVCTKLENESPLRIKPECAHFSDCNGCHYLHTSYEQELNFKLQTFERMLSRLNIYNPQVKIIKNQHRFNYRNRVQLHYDIKKNKLGFKQKNSNQILTINNCLIASKKIQTEIQKITQNSIWKTLVPKNSRSKGHLELYDDGTNVNYFWNQRYAAGGFTQVNPAVNELLQQEISQHFNHKKLTILDLFGGNGNLVNHLDCEYKLSVDLYEHSPKPNQLHLDLFKPDALTEFEHSTAQKFNTLFIDPPRSGFKDLGAWITKLAVDQILYVSCHPATMVRDLSTVLNKYEIKQIYLIEFFPGTFHFEAAIILNKKLN